MNRHSQSNLNPLFVTGAYFLFLSLSCLLFDFLVGLLFVDENNRFKNYPLPPYGAIITNAQKERFESLMNDKNDGYIIFDPFLGWNIGPNRTEQNGMYVSNSYGMRGAKEYSLDVPEGVIRIAAFGDSFTEGVDVNTEQVWTYLLEQSLENVEVLNFGVRAFGQDQAWLRYRRDGRPFKPHIVFIGFMLENIRRSVNRYRPAYEHNTGGLGIKPRFILTDGTLKLLPNPVSSRYELKRLIEFGTIFDVVGQYDYWYGKFKFAFNENNFLFRFNTVKIAWLAYEKYERDLKKLYRETDKEPFLVTTKLLESFYEETLQDGAKMSLVIIFPAKSHLEDYIEDHHKFWQSLIDFFEQNNMNYIDLTERLAETHKVTPIVYGHYTSEGNIIVQSVLKEWIVKNVYQTNH